MSRSPGAFRPPAFASRVIHSPLRGWASLTVGLPGLRPDLIGIPRSTRTSCDRGGRPLYPEDGGAHTAGSKSPAATCRIPAATSLHLGHASTIRGST
jgi:hypothetical protein